MPSAAGDRRWVLWMLDHGQYMGGGAELVEENSWLQIWVSECNWGVGLDGGNYGEF